MGDILDDGHNGNRYESHSRGAGVDVVVPAALAVRNGCRVLDSRRKKLRRTIPSTVWEWEEHIDIENLDMSENHILLQIFGSWQKVPDNLVEFPRNSGFSLPCSTRDLSRMPEKISARMAHAAGFPAGLPEIEDYYGKKFVPRDILLAEIAKAESALIEAWKSHLCERKSVFASGVDAFIAFAFREMCQYEFNDEEFAHLCQQDVQTQARTLDSYIVDQYGRVEWDAVKKFAGIK